MEKHSLHKGQYIAYDKEGFAFRIDRALGGGWRAKPSHAAAKSDYRLFYARTLKGLGDKVAESTRKRDG